MSSNIKNNIVQHLLKNSNVGVLHKGAVVKAAKTFGVNRKIIYRLWKAVSQQMKNGEPAIMVAKLQGIKEQIK